MVNMLVLGPREGIKSNVALAFEYEARFDCGKLWERLAFVLLARALFAAGLAKVVMEDDLLLQPPLLLLRDNMEKLVLAVGRVENDDAFETKLVLRCFVAINATALPIFKLSSKAFRACSRSNSGWLHIFSCMSNFLRAILLRRSQKKDGCC